MNTEDLRLNNCIIIDLPKSICYIVEFIFYGSAVGRSFFIA